MIPLREVRVLDGNAQALGVPVATLMENAGRAVADVVDERFPDGTVVVLAGTGNNGGDGLVAARFLAARREVRVFLVGGTSMRGNEAAAALAALPASVDVVEDLPSDLKRDLGGAGVIVDAMLGVGLAGSLREPYRRVVASLGSFADRVVSVDVPTGLGTDVAVKPAVTVTFHDVKEGMMARNSGEIVVKDIGIPAEAATHTGPGEMTLYPPHRHDQHKGEGGFVLIIGGGPYTGAPAMAAVAAMRTGADLAVVLTPRKCYPVIASFTPNIVVRPLNGDDVDFGDPENRVNLNLWMRRADAVVVGPGMGKLDMVKESTHVAVRAALENRKPVVIDADALWGMADDLKGLRGPTVVTPHAAEFKALTGETLPKDMDERVETVHAFAGKLGNTFLVKGPVDIISDGERTKRNATGCPQMSVGGTGDVLAGVTGALLAKGLIPFDAARVSAFVTGLAGEHAAQERPYGMLASDVVEALPRVLARFLPPASKPRY